MRSPRRLRLLRAVRLAVPPAVLVCVLVLGGGLGARASGHAPPPRLGAAQRVYLDALMEEAGRRTLWEQRYWHVLLHYHRNRILPGLRSEADGAGFFNSPHGKVDPREELEGTLARFFSEDPLPPAGMTAQCTFPARYHWLAARLAFDPARLPPQECPRFERWRTSLDPGSVTLVYASYFFNVPASMFGHTLLRLDKKERAEGERLLDYGVNYAAYTDPSDTAFGYAVRGLGGGYKGRFSLLPYYIKVREYNDFENRDLWEYRLTFTQEQIDRLLRHTWEMGSTEFDYYFIDENCSYHLLSLLEAANPELHLTDRFSAFALPVDTIRVVLEQPGLVTGVQYRPSRSSQMEHKLSFLAPELRALVPELVEDPELLEHERFAALPPRERALILEAAADYYQIEVADSGGEDPKLRAGLRRLLVARSRLGPVTDDIAEPAPPPLPESGHDSSRIELAAGADGDRHRFVELSGQPLMHDLMAQESGYPPNSDVQVLPLRVRAEEVPQPPDPVTGVQPGPAVKLRLQHLHLAHVISLFPWTDLERTFSWRFRAGWERTREGGLPCEPCVPFVVDGGAGIALQSNRLTRTVVFTMLEPTLQFGRMFDGGVRYGLGLSLGVLLDLGDRWRVGLIGRSSDLRSGDVRKNVGRAVLTQRFSLGRNLDLRLDWLGEEDYREGRIALGYFF